MSLERVAELVGHTENGFESLASQILSENDKKDFMYDFLETNKFFSDIISDIIGVECRRCSGGI